MEKRPKSTAADISREVRGWAGFTIVAFAVVAAVYTATKGKEMMTSMLGGRKKPDDEFDVVS